MKPSDYVDIGQYLRESRESLHISLEQAAIELHIRAKYLRALESGDMQDMPGKAYIRGYIRTYAQYLHLDETEVLESYALLLQPKGHELFIPEQTLEHNTPSRRLTYVSLAGLIMLYIFWYFGFHDRTPIQNTTIDVPHNFVHVADEASYPMMDEVWQECLSVGYDGCYIMLRDPLVRPRNEMIYDVKDDIFPR